MREPRRSRCVDEHVHTGWELAVRAAREPAPAATYRRRLAREIQRASGARFAAVFTCPPGNPLEAQMDISPRERAPLVRRIHARFLAEIERSEDGMRLAAQVGAQAYAPLEKSGRRALVRRLRAEVLTPAGVVGLLNAFLALENAPPIGWICLGTSQSSAEALTAVGRPLTEVARAATGTLSAALDLAAACGARLPSTVAPVLDSLSPRERQIAALVATGLSDANVAARLTLSEETVGSHLRRIYAKLGVHSRVELVTRLSPVEARTFALAD